jgi:tetratricopeptide (TPR) repeat protein
MRLDEAERLIRRCLKNEEEEQRQGKRDTGDRTGWSPHPSASYVDTLGWVFYRQGKLDQALRELDRALALPGGDDPEIWEHRGDILNALNRRVEAISSWRRALVQLETIPHHSKASRRNILVEKLRPGEATPAPPKR